MCKMFVRFIVDAWCTGVKAYTITVWTISQCPVHASSRPRIPEVKTGRQHAANQRADRQTGRLAGRQTHKMVRTTGNI